MSYLASPQLLPCWYWRGSNPPISRHQRTNLMVSWGLAPIGGHPIKPDRFLERESRYCEAHKVNFEYRTSRNHLELHGS